MTAPQRNSNPLSRQRRYYCAGGRSQAQIKLSPDNLVFMALGTFFDKVGWRSRTAQLASGDDHAQWEAPVKKEPLTRFTKYRNGECEAYQRTLVADLGPPGEAIRLSLAYDAFQDRPWRGRC